MSRRHSQDRSLAPALEADPEAVAHLAALDDVPGDASRPALPWWFATPMPEPWDAYLWHQWPSAWDEVTLRVCGSVWRTTGARMYAVHRDSELRADLYDWLIVRAVELQASFTPRPGHPAPEANRGAFLRENLTEAARWHFSKVVGSARTENGHAAIDAHNRGIQSTEHLDELQAETGATYTRHPLHGDDLQPRPRPHPHPHRGPRHPDPADRARQRPLRDLLHLEYPRSAGTSPGVASTSAGSPRLRRRHQQRARVPRRRWRPPW